MSATNPLPPTPVPSETAVEDDGFDLDALDREAPPPPPRRRKAPFLTSLLALGLACAVGVVGGILIQKHWGGSAPAAGFSRSALASAAGGTGASVAGGSGTAGAGLGRGGFGGGGGFASRLGTVGTVKAIAGRSFYVTTLDGNTVKVTPVAGAVVRVTANGTVRSIEPGDFLTVQGSQTATGVSATSITVGGGGGGFGGLGGGGTSAGGAGSSPGGATGRGAGTSSTPALPGLGG